MTLRTAHASAAFLLITLSLAAGVSPNSAHAFSDWPSRAVKLIVPFPAGSANDIAARMYSEGLSKRWSRPVIVDNRPGADAFVGGEALTDTADDHTLLYTTAAMITVNPLLHEPIPYDPILDMVPIAPGAGAILVVAVTNSLPVFRICRIMSSPSGARSRRPTGCHRSSLAASPSNTTKTVSVENSFLPGSVSGKSTSSGLISTVHRPGTTVPQLTISSPVPPKGSPALSMPASVSGNV